MTTHITAGDVDLVFRAILGRPPENAAVVQNFLDTGDLDTVLTLLRASDEASIRNRSGPFWQFNAQIDALGIIHSHEDRQRTAITDRLVNFLGVVVDPAYLPAVLAGQAGVVEGLPLPANWHADIAEFAAALRAVDLATTRFRVLELGCGWGCWLLNTGVAARRRGLSVDLIGAEGDEGHVAFAERACAENGFIAEQARIHRGVVGPAPGTALFPKQDEAGLSWGLEPIFQATPEQIAEASRGGRYDILPILTLDALAGDEPIDLVHIDIQGGEADFVEGCLPALNRLVSYLVIGTHSRQIEGRIMGTLLAGGWILEIERPAVLGFDPAGEPFVRVDGVQGWRNAALKPS